MEKVLVPIRQELAKDDLFTLNAAKQVSAKLRSDRNSTLLELAESELEVSAENVPPLSGDLTSKQVDAVDSILRNSFGVDWFKNRKTFSASIDTISRVDGFDLYCLLLVIKANAGSGG